MFIQLEKGESVDVGEIIGVFDFDTATLSADTRSTLKRVSGETGVISLCADLPKSFLLTDGQYYDRIYISGLSTDSIRKRYETSKGMKTVWKKKETK